MCQEATEIIQGEQKMSEPKIPDGVFEIKQFGMPGENAISELIPVAGGKSVFIGDGAVTIIQGNQPMRVPFQFNIDAENITEAFEKAKDAAKAELPNVRKEIEEKIQEAQQNQSHLVLPDHLKNKE